MQDAALKTSPPPEDKVTWLCNLLGQLYGLMPVIDHAQRQNPCPVDAAWFEEQRCGLRGVFNVLMTATIVSKGIAEHLVIRGLSERNALQLEHAVRALVADLMRSWVPNVKLPADERLLAKAPKLFGRLRAIHDRLRAVPSLETVARSKEHDGLPDVTHAPDFTWLRCAAGIFHFKMGNQAEAIRVLYEVWQKSGCRDGCGLGESTIGELIKSSSDNFRMAVTFAGHSGLGSIIRSVSKGVFALYLGSNPPQ